jgi:class 3 adenylate cyclase/tetratricopeptide (TPR) repeat protein
VATCSTCGHESAGAFKFCPECGAPATAAAAAREQRKVVTVLFCDITGSTGLGERLDPESLRSLLAAYFERMKAIVERHGGTVEKFIGDAVMAVFGVPVLHEDDALRAMLAAAEMRDALPELGVEGRIGLATGEIVTGTEERLATGDAVNVAARLEQAAQPGEVLLAAETLELVRAAVEVEAVEPLALKGKSDPVQAYRLLAVSTGVERRHDTPMVGRKRQRHLLDEAYANVVTDRTCNLFTILGAAGVGKSRLANEFLTDLDTRVVRGRCLSYGDGITYWPVVEVLKQLGTRPEDEAAAAVVAALLGESDGPTAPDQIAWAVRRTLEDAARERPLVVVFDDIHWGEPAFLELVEHVADLTRDTPILLLCMARPDLLDRRPGWAGGKLNATTVLLEPLSATEADELIGLLAPVDEGLRVRIRDASEGNPLFLEEMLALVRESGEPDLVVPPTIQALLAARLDQLQDSERVVLECGAVEGGVFHRGAVEALAPDEEHVAARLITLVRKELVRSERTQLAGDEAFRFRHLLSRDAAYDAMPKALRAGLHEQFGRWLERRGNGLVELDEIVGYHFEQACRYRSELNLPPNRHIAAAACERLSTAGRRAFVREDYVAAGKLLERATTVSPEIDNWLEFDAQVAMFFAGDGAGARERARSLAESATTSGDRIAELSWRIHEAVILLYLEPEGATDLLTALIEEAKPQFETAGDDFALYLCHWGTAQVAHMRCQFDAGLEAREQALALGREAGLVHHEAWFVPQLATNMFFGTRPVQEVLAWLDEQEARGFSLRVIESLRAQSLAMLGRSDEARAILSRMRNELAERGAAMQLALTLSLSSSDVELLAGNPATAAEFGREGCRMLGDAGQPAWQSTGMGILARAFYELDQLDEADAAAQQAAALGASDDAITQVLWRQVKAKVLARQGDHAEAERLAREAVAIAETTDMLSPQGDAYADLAEVLTLADRNDEAAAALEEAAARFDRKGNIVSAERARVRLAQLRPVEHGARSQA